MTRNDLTKIIGAMGIPYDELVERKKIPENKLFQLYEDEDTLGFDILPGLYLEFYTENTWLTNITFDFEISSENADSRFKEILPHPLDKINFRKDAFEVLGKPFLSKAEGELTKMGFREWDTYQLKTSMHPAANLDIQYGDELEVKCIQISLISNSY